MSTLSLSINAETIVQKVIAITENTPCLPAGLMTQHHSTLTSSIYIRLMATSITEGVIILTGKWAQLPGPVSTDPKWEAVPLRDIPEQYLNLSMNIKGILHAPIST